MEPKKGQIKKDAEVYILAGEFRKMSGKVLRVLDNKVVVQGVNVRKKHVKPNRGQKGGIVSIEKPIHISNVCLKK